MNVAIPADAVGAAMMYEVVAKPVAAGFALPRWVILRTSGGQTLTLAMSLRGAGYDAWTPAETISVRIPRSKQRRDRDIPILPTFVFVRAEHLSDLYLTMSAPVSAHPQFSVFQHLGRIPLLADRDIASLREAEDKARRAFEAARMQSERRALLKLRHQFRIGSAVRVEGGVAQGMSGIVEGSDGKSALVCFGGAVSIRVASFLLRSDVVDDGQPA